MKLITHEERKFILLSKPQFVDLCGRRMHHHAQQFFAGKNIAPLKDLLMDSSAQ
jgi:hypothetical protein